MRRDRGLRRVPRRLPAAHPGPAGVGADLSVRVAGDPGQRRAVDRRAHLLQARRRLRAVLHALTRGLPAVPAGGARRAARRWPDDRIWAELQKRFALDGWSVSEGPITDKSVTADAQLRRRADAARPAVPRRRRGAHRAADRRQGPQPRAVRRGGAGERAPRAAERGRWDAGRRLLRHLPAPGLAGHPLLLVDDLDAARHSGLGRVRLAAPAGPAQLRHVLPAPRRCRWPRTTPATNPSASSSDEPVTAGDRRGRRRAASSADSAAAVPVPVSARPGSRGHRLVEQLQGAQPVP